MQPFVVESRRLILAIEYGRTRVNPDIFSIDDVAVRIYLEAFSCLSKLGGQ
jgi:hypothetical protein